MAGLAMGRWRGARYGRASGRAWSVAPVGVAPGCESGAEKVFWGRARSSSCTHNFVVAIVVLCSALGLGVRSGPRAGLKGQRGRGHNVLALARQKYGSCRLRTRALSSAKLRKVTTLSYILRLVVVREPHTPCRALPTRHPSEPRCTLVAPLLTCAP